MRYQHKANTNLGIKRKTNLYKSLPTPTFFGPTGRTEKIEMIRKSTLIVADLRKFARDTEATTTFYDPPKKLNLFAGGRRQFGLLRINEKPHNPDCSKQPLNCKCEDIPWIHQKLPGAVKHVRSGKWMIFADKRNVIEIWEKVKMLLLAYQLGYFAKVQTESDASKHLICVYTQDYEDIPDVFRVLLTLRRNCLQNDTIYYKTCEASRKGVYATDEMANKFGFPSAPKLKSGQRVSMYYSPPISFVSNEKGNTEVIQLILNNIGPEYRIGLVAESRKDSGESEATETFYNPPQILNDAIQHANRQQLLLLPLLPCKYHYLIIKAWGCNSEEKFHKGICDRQPKTCQCVTWISASRNARINPIYTGKWMLFATKKQVNEIWEKLKILLAANRLGTRIKVSTVKFFGKYFVCVYTNDSENVQDVFRVLVTLRRNRLSLGYLNYKTHEATQQKLYTNAQVAHMNDCDSAKELEPGRRMSMYCSPPTGDDVTGANELIQLYLNNIGPVYRTGLVAELRKNSSDIDAELKFYNPPQMLDSTLNLKSSLLGPIPTV
jgi:hypothetical protein